MSFGGGIRAGQTFVEITSRDGQLRRGLARADRMVKGWARGINMIGRQLFMASAAGGALFGLSAKTFADFEQKVAEASAVSGDFAGNFDRLKDKAAELGRTTSFTASQVADGMKYMAMAGYNAEQILAGIPAVLDLARAGAVDLGVASDIATDVASAFGFTADEIGRVADVLTKAAISSNTSVEQLGHAMAYAGAQGKLTGQSIEEVTAAISVLSNRGIKASAAGSTVARVLARLSSSANVKSLRAIGVEVYGLDGRFRQLTDIMDDLGRVTGTWSEEQRNGFLGKTFGDKAIRGAVMLSDANDEFRMLLAKNQDASGVAGKVAGQMSDTLSGQFVSLGSAIEGTAIAVGEALMPALRYMVEGLTPVIRGFAEWGNENPELIQGLAAATLGIGAIGAGLIVLSPLLTATMTAMVGLGAAVGGVVSMAVALASPLGVIAAGAAFMAYQAGAISRVGEAATEAGTAIWATFGQGWEAIAASIRSGDLEGAFDIVMATIKLAWSQLMDELSRLWNDFADSVGNIGYQAGENAANFIDAVVSGPILAMTDTGLGSLYRKQRAEEAARQADKDRETAWLRNEYAKRGKVYEEPGRRASPATREAQAALDQLTGRAIGGANGKDLVDAIAAAIPGSVADAARSFGAIAGQAAGAVSGLSPASFGDAVVAGLARVTGSAIPTSSANPVDQAQAFLGQAWTGAIGIIDKALGVTTESSQQALASIHDQAQQVLGVAAAGTFNARALDSLRQSQTSQQDRQLKIGEKQVDLLESIDETLGEGLFLWGE